MRTLYDKSESGVAVLAAGAYVLLGWGAGALDRAVGIEFLFRAAVFAGMTAAILLFIRSSGRAAYYGLQRPVLPARRFLWYLPLAAIVSGNLWFGVALRDAAAQTALHLAVMLLIGILEELLFRGLLYRALEQKSETAAIVVSSLVFGLLHLLNLTGGTAQPLVLLQTAFATALGFVFALILARGKSLIPCIAAHCAINITAVFTDQTVLTLPRCAAVNGSMTGIAALYFLFLFLTADRQS